MTAPRPPSVVSQTHALLSLLGFFAVLAGFRWFGLKDAVTCFILLVVALALPHIWTAIAPEQVLIGPERGRREVLERNLCKLAGLAAMYGALALAYFGFQGFYEAHVSPLWGLFQRVWLPLLLLSPVYVWLTDRHMENPHDGLYHVGLAVTGSLSHVDRNQAVQYVLGWCVKGFFIPLMATYALGDIRWFLSAELLDELRRPGAYYDVAFRFLFFIDVVFGAAGYLCALRLINAHIRSTEPTMLGWVVCIMCYEPFWPVFSHNFLPYEDGYFWNDWLANTSLAGVAWSAVILAWLAVYVWATVTFGVRFSNLTNRGILTNGPYRWMKHPAYVAKNVAWWMISIPFLTQQSPEIAIRNCLLLAALNIIYLLRAKTEEWHLSRDPAYLAYAEWIKVNGLAAMMRRGSHQLAEKLGRSSSPA